MINIVRYEYDYQMLVVSAKRGGTGPYVIVRNIQTAKRG